MKKIIKLLLTIPLITTPFCFSCSKKEPPNAQEKTNQYNYLKMINDLLFINKNKGDTHNNESTLRYYIYEILIEVPNALNGDSKTTEKIIFDLIEKITAIANKEKLQQNDIDFLDKTQTKIKIILEKIENDIWKEKMGEQGGRVDLEND